MEADVYFKVGQRINLFQGIVGKQQLEDLEREANEPGFDIDASGIDGEDNPKLPEPAVALSDIDHLLSAKGFTPPESAFSHRRMSLNGSW